MQQRVGVLLAVGALSAAAACVGDSPAGSSGGGATSSSGTAEPSSSSGDPSSSSGGASSSGAATSSSGGNSSGGEETDASTDAGTFLPTEIADLALWFDADRGIEGTTVTNWTEQTSLINARGDQGWTDGGACVAPTRIPNEVKGHSVVRFNGTTSCLVLDQRFSSNYYDFTAGTTLFIVAKPAASSQSDGEAILALATDQNKIDNTMSVIRLPDTQGVNLKTRTPFSAQMPDNQAGASTTAGVFVPAEAHVFTATLEAGDAGTKNNQGVQFYLDGVAAPMVGKAALTLPGAPRKLSLIGRFVPGVGNPNTSSTGYYTGDLGEIVFYKRTLSLAERQQVESYLLAKWR